MRYPGFKICFRIPTCCAATPRHTDTYDRLSDKTVMWFSAAVTTVDADFYMKVDDDVHIRIPALGGAVQVESS
jgi:hypothetical protein